jgi:hypothetical protein
MSHRYLFGILPPLLMQLSRSGNTLKFLVFA